MSTKTIRRIPTFLVITVMGLAAVVFWPSLRASMVKENHEVVVITITFDPARRSGYPPGPGRTLIDHVMFQITMSGEFLPKEFVTQSPQVRTLVPIRGANSSKARIGVYAEQVYGKTLSCRIDYPGQQSEFKSAQGPSSLECGMSVQMSGK